jgi:hypothetical protein
VQITEPSESDRSGCLYACFMLALAAWIAFYPAPYWLALGIAVIVPPLAFFCYRPDKSTLDYAHLMPPTRQYLLNGTCAFLVWGLAYRWWREYSLIDPVAWALVSLTGATVLTMLSLLYRRSGDMIFWRGFTFTLYAASVAGLANVHFDTAPPVYVQGIVTDTRYINGDGRRASRYGRTMPRQYTIGPYLKSEKHTIELKLFERSAVKEGDPMCSARYSGALGFQWSTLKPSLCPVADAAARVAELRQHLRAVGNEYPESITHPRPVP